MARDGSTGRGGGGRAGTEVGGVDESPGKSLIFLEAEQMRQVPLTRPIANITRKQNSRRISPI